MHPPSPTTPSRQSGRKSGLLQRFATGALIVVLLGLIGARAYWVEVNVGGYTGCHGCFIVPSLGADLWLLGCALGLLAIGCLSRWDWLRVLARSVVLMLAVAMALDLLLLQLFSQRLHIGDLFHFGGQMGANWSVLRSSLQSTPGFITAIAALGTLSLLLNACRAGGLDARVGKWLIVLAVPSLALAWGAQALRPVQYVHASLVENVVSVNLAQGSTREFSTTHIDRQRGLLARTPRICQANPQANRPNVIILLAESLSSWHSKLLGSANDWTPRLDAIARDNHYFTHFYANGFTTSGAEIAIGSGQLPINPPAAFEYSFKHFAGIEPSLASLAHAAGFQALFFTPGDTSFLGIGDWLKGIGFDEVHGSRDDYYSAMQRFQFNAVEDRVFYRRFIDWYDTRTGNQPFVAVLLSVSSHPPFINPETGKVDPQGAFRYVDAQIGVFHDALEARGFMDNGILVVMGDHRTMTPLSADEFQRYGDRAFARVPMIVAGKVEMPAVIDDAFQQTDVLPSLAWQIGVDFCRLPYTGSFLRPDPKPPSIVVHARGDDRNRVDIYQGPLGTFGYHLKGDDSNWVGGQPQNAAAIAAWIDVQRADAQVRGQKR